MRYSWAYATLLLLLACGPAGDPDDSAAPQATSALLTEHHAHIRSLDARDVLIEIQEAVGETVIEPDEGAVTAAHLIAAMDSAGVDRAQVLSVGYFFGFPDFEVVDEERRLRAENDYVAEQVSRYPDRLAGACSVNPLTEYAPAEVTRCANDDRLSGLKLHFANSDVDLRDQEDVARIQAVFRAASDGDLPIVVHMRTRAPDYGSRDVDVFIDEILSQAPGLPVQIAHMAGWGGYDDATDEALGTFVAAFDSGRLDPSLYSFDLAAVVMPPSRAEPDSARVRAVSEANEMLAGRIRALGPEHVLYATDWDAIALAPYLRGVREILPLSADEISDILDNVGPMFR